MVAESIHIINKIDTDSALIELRSDGIVKVLFKENLVLDIAEQEILFEYYKAICEGKKHPFLFTAMDNVVITKEARENSKKLEKTAPSMATAILVNSLPYRLIANFYKKFNKPKIPFHVFSQEKEAIEWLYKQQKEYEKKRSR